MTDSKLHSFHPVRSQRVERGATGKSDLLRAGLWPMSPNPLIWTARFAFFALCAAISATALAADKPNDSQPRWQYGGGDARVRLESAERTPAGARTEKPCDHLRFVTGAGTSAYFHRDFGTARVIPELSLTLWVKSNRAGAQLAARVVLPRSIDPRSGAPMTTLVRGTRYERVGQWQRLEVTRIDQSVARTARAFRSEFGPRVDEREAYVDLAVVNAYGGQGPIEVWLDELEIHAGVEAAPTRQRAPASNEITAQSVGRGARVANDRPSGNWTSAGGRLASSRAPSEETATGEVSTDRTRSRVRIQGGSLIVHGRRMAPRIVRYQGESLEYLRRLGFNAVYTSRAFSERLSNEAREAGIWLITPPPEEEVRSAGAESVFRDSGDGASNYDTVLAWTLGEAATAEDLAATQETVRALRRDRRLRRPLVVDPAERIAEYSRVADVLLIGGVSPWSATDPSRETEWQAERRKVARPGTPVWMRIETQPDPLLVEQWRILAPSLARRIGVEYEQIQASVYEALFQGARGLFFESASRLDAQDEATRSRAAALELINSQLEIIAPWTNGGTVGADAMTTDPSVKATVLRTNRALLVVPRKVAANLSAEKSEPSDGEIAMIVPGAPEASEVFELSPTGIRPLRHRRVNGGTRVTLDQLDSSTMVMMTQDPVLIGELTRRLAEQAERTARLARELATRRYELIAAAGGGSISFSVLRGGGANGSAPNLSGGSAVGQEDRLAAARTQLAECDRRMEARDWRRAYRHAIRAMELLHLDDRQAEPPSETADGTAVNSPLAVHPLLNSLDGRLVRQVAAAAPRSVVRLFDSFEDPRQSVAAGWRHIHHRHPGVATDVTFSANSPHSGRMAIRIDASAETENGGAADRELVETPPVWVVSPPVPVSAGTILLVEGWVRAPEPITEGAHSLIVFDSIGGEALAERIDSTGDWRRFRLLRAVPENGPMTVTFAMTGLGEAYVDDVSVAEIPGAAVGRLDQTRRMRGAFGAPLAPVRR